MLQRLKDDAKKEGRSMTGFHIQTDKDTITNEIKDSYGIDQEAEEIKTRGGRRRNINNSYS